MKQKKVLSERHNKMPH